MNARIYRPAKNAMQSGRGSLHKWVLEFAPSSPKRLDPLTGWTGSGDMRRQVKLRFPNREACIAYAEGQGIAYDVEEPQERKTNIRAYADNFR